MPGSLLFQVVFFFGTGSCCDIIDPMPSRQWNHAVSFMVYHSYVSLTCLEDSVEMVDCSMMVGWGEEMIGKDEESMVDCREG